MNGLNQSQVKAQFYFILQYELFKCIWSFTFFSYKLEIASKTDFTVLWKLFKIHFTIVKLFYLIGISKKSVTLNRVVTKFETVVQAETNCSLLSLNPKIAIPKKKCFSNVFPENKVALWCHNTPSRKEVFKSVTKWDLHFSSFIPTTKILIIWTLELKIGNIKNDLEVILDVSYTWYKLNFKEKFPFLPW